MPSLIASVQVGRSVSFVSQHLEVQMNIPLILIPTFGLVALISCQPSNRVNPSSVFTLYRSSASAPGARIHVATFDANDSMAYNRENAEAAAKLFQQQPGVTVRFWIEPGHFKQ